jgi:hypothetical protein
MNPRIFILAGAIAALAAPVATAATINPVPAEAIMTLRSLGDASWTLDIQNSTPAPVAIRHVTWTAPDGLTVSRIVSVHGGTCAPTSSGFQCTTQLASPSCASCAGGDLTVHFKGTGPGRTWVTTSSGGYWQNAALAPGHADLTVSAEHSQLSKTAASAASL